MVLSVSRRSDIPNYYSDWFYNRIKEGFVYVRNPRNVHQVSKIKLSPETTDCIVFWTKNPEPMMDRLEELSAYPYYFQFTLTGYGKDIEPNIPHKKEKMIPIFQKLSDKIGKNNIIWRYDPILFTSTYTPEYHIKAFEQIAYALEGYTDTCVISFVDVYRKNKKNLMEVGICEEVQSMIIEVSQKMSKTAKAHGMKIGSCAEQMDLSQYGIEHNCCIDKKRIESMLGLSLIAGKDKNQRLECGCMESIEIGAYDTCRNGCKYCYANENQVSVQRNCSKYDVNSPLLCSSLTKEDTVKERNVSSLKKNQLELDFYRRKYKNS